MCRYIGIEDLVASASIEVMEGGENNRRVSLQSLSNYGTVIVEALSRLGQDAILFLTKESTYDFVNDYSDFFSIVEYDGVEYIELTDDITTVDLRHQFRKNMTVDLAKALSEAKSVAALKA